MLMLLRQLSAEARSELLQIIGAELADLKSELNDPRQSRGLIG